jgi:hypothetical protein
VIRCAARLATAVAYVVLGTAADMVIRAVHVGWGYGR